MLFKVGVTIIVIVGLVAAASLWVYNKNHQLVVNQPEPHQQATPGGADTQITNWETYTDSEYAFQLRYPRGWSILPHGVDFVLSATDADKDSHASSISIHVFEGFEGVKVENIYNGEIDKKIDFKNDCKSIKFAGFAGYDCPHSSYRARRVIFFYKDNLPWAIYDDIADDTSDAIIHSFRFTTR